MRVLVTEVEQRVRRDDEEGEFMYRRGSDAGRTAEEKRRYLGLS